MRVLHNYRTVEKRMIKTPIKEKNASNSPLFARYLTSNGGFSSFFTCSTSYTKLSIIIISLILLSACASTSAKIHHIEIIKYKFVPSEITVQPGDTIIWTNKEKRQYHSVWFKATNPKEPDYIFPDETFEKTFEGMGDFPYECGPHPKMKGLVKVLSSKNK